MTTTYDITQLNTSQLFQARFQLGDTDLTSAQLQDEEIAWALLTRGNLFGGCAMCALALAAKYSRLTSISADGVSQQLQQKAAQFNLMAKEFQRKETIYRASPTLGGVSIADMKGVLSNTDRVPDIFRIGLSDDPPTDGTQSINSPPLGMNDPVYGP